MQASRTLLIFLSRGYFSSKNCRRELYAALDANLPLVVLHESDDKKGGAPLAALRAECDVHCRERPEAARVVFEASA